MTTRPTRSWMFVPGNKERFLAKAAESDADCVFLDLEDGVLPDFKDQARTMVAGALRRPFRPQCYVRLNAASTRWFAADLAEVVPSGPAGVCLPKCEDAGQVTDLAALLDDLERRHSLPPGSTGIVAAIESPAAVLAAASIARAHPRVVALMLGAEDLALDIGLGTARVAEAAELLFARSMVVYAAAAARVVSIDGVFPNLDDPAGMERDTLQARRLGFTAKSTFNPRQVAVINRVFSPRPDEIAYARRVADAFQSAQARGDASVAVGGQLVDRPIVARACRLLQLAQAELATDGRGGR
jgi:citrate lyase subunit beta / citryl-CoA lyase